MKCPFPSIHESTCTRKRLLGEINKLNDNVNVDEKISKSIVGVESALGLTIYERINIQISAIVFPESKNVKGILGFEGTYRFPIGKGEKIWSTE